MTRKLALVAAALTVMFSYGMSTHAVKADDRKTCVEFCKKQPGGGRGMTKCVNNCVAAN